MRNPVKEKLIRLQSYIEEELEKNYEKVLFEVNEKQENWFKISNNHFVHVDRMMESDKEGSILLEHAESMEERYLAEDGDRFFPDDYKKDHDLIRAVLKEATDE